MGAEADFRDVFDQRVNPGRDADATLHDSRTDWLTDVKAIVPVFASGCVDVSCEQGSEGCVVGADGSTALSGASVSSSLTTLICDGVGIVRISWLRRGGGGCMAACS